MSNANEGPTGGDGRVALITGGARGIGRVCAETLARDGWRIAVADRDPDAPDLPPDTLTLRVDVSDADACRACVAEVVARCGRLDALINNAGVFRNEPLLDTDPATFDRLMSVNVRGAFFMLQAAARAMREAGNGGAIVNMSSAAGRSGRPTQAVYAMTKAALISLTKSSALAFAADGIRVAAVCPIAVEDTDMWNENVSQRRAVGGDADVAAFMASIPLGRPCRPQEVADVVAFFCSPRASFMTGVTLDVSGGREM